MIAFRHQIVMAVFAAPAAAQDVRVSIGPEMSMFFVAEKPLALYIQSNGLTVDIDEALPDGLTTVDKLHLLKQAYDEAKTDEDRAAIQRWADELMSGLEP